MKKVKLYKIVWYTRVKGKPWKKEGIIRRGLLYSTAKKYVHEQRKKMSVELKRIDKLKIVFDRYRPLKSGKGRKKKSIIREFFGW